MVIGQERTLDWLAGAVVVPDGGGQCEDALQDAGDDPGWGAPAVALQVELSFERVVDRFDDLPQRLEELGPGPFALAFAGRAQQA